MALIKCHECGAEISSESKSCPKCGAKPPYRPSAVFVLIVVLLVVFAVKASFTEHKPPREKTPEEIAADHRTRMAYVMMRKIKTNLREPDSLDVIQVYSNDKADLLCMKYRARNGFGGYSVGYYVIGEFGDSDHVRAWNTFCTGEMYDVTAAKHLL